MNAATAATLRRKVFTKPGRLVRSGRRRWLRLPENWPWAAASTAAVNTIHRDPPALLNAIARSGNQDLGKPADRWFPARPQTAELFRTDPSRHPNVQPRPMADPSYRLTP
jgi:hypothetical protein